MKIHNILGQGLIAAMAFTLSACSDSHMEEINTDETKVTNLDPNAQLTTSLLQTYGDFSLMDTYRNYITGFTQHFAGGWNVTNYAGAVHHEDDIARRIWDRYYEVAIKNLVDAIHKSEDKANLNAALRIHRVFLLSVLADTYGDIPASEAGLGYISGISTPKYDTVEEIYNWFFEELSACEAQLGTGSDRISGDVTSLGGEVAKWKKYANSLRMRYAMRISDVNPQKAQKEFEAAVGAGYIASAADDAYIKYSDSPFTYYDGANDYDFRTNALGEILYGQDPSSPTFVSSTLFYQMQNTSDPRLYRICRHYYNIKRSQVKPDKEQNIDLTDEVLAYFKRAGIGEEPCNTGAAWYENWMNVAETKEFPTLQKWADNDANTYDNSDYRARLMRPCLNIDFEMPSCPGILFTYAEAELLLAEAKTKGWNVGGEAESHYEAGVRAAMEMLNNYYLTSNKISSDEIDSFLAHNPLSDNPKEAINTQAWILHLMNPSEAWANMRRSDYPAVLDRSRLGTFPGDGFVYDDPDLSMPTRLRYPELEGQYNSINYHAAIERMGGTDDWHKSLWWDKGTLNVQSEFNPPFGKGYVK
ncbi:SusD/RagB family nutrient-binding outer membrane lipoprotein [Prevotella sp. P5-92]|uniref:SusD/RagB family nutrient-binding outer membrane lipoprotein n=1 Tax=Prevotella sp. P5-92 TaxID=2024222 RepID=UPI000B96C11D|nr:SusD/RagB family nutrient-binding outer membrane lipoprotein [Prevotella sp. P5-92]OYP57512.1 SusD/RagB family nutrient-binding outer membrane lipoprotein [Prevotella sp. P5-92]